MNIADVVSYAEAITAVQAHQKVTVLRNDGVMIHGMLRALTVEDGSPAFIHGDGDPHRAWVWITTVQGFETWVQLDELVELARDSQVAYGG